jgi:hypothetical protein
MHEPRVVQFNLKKVVSIDTNALRRVTLSRSLFYDQCMQTFNLKPVIN